MQLNDRRLVLGESPIWHPSRQQFFWVNIVEGHVYGLTSNQRLTQFPLPDKVGCIVPTHDGHLIAALSRDLVHLNLDSGEVCYLLKNAISSDEMFNDGKVDSQGRFWVASKDKLEETGKGKLYCFDGESLTCHEENLIVGNGMDWSVDSKTMYLCDSPRGHIYAYDFANNDGTLSNKRLFKEVRNGFPDGLTIDINDNVYSAHWGGSCLSVYSPKGELIDTWHYPARNITSITFGGDDLKTVLVTSAARDVANEELNQDGYVFLKQLSQAGKSTNCFTGTIAPLD